MRVVFCWLHERIVLLAACATLLATHARAQSAPLLTGRVTDAATGAALSGVDLSLADGARALTGADGRFRLRALEPGPTRLQVRRVGYIAAQRSLTLRNGEEVLLALTLTRVPAILATVRARDTASRGDLTRLTRDDIARSNPRDLGDVVRGVPGVLLIPRGGPGAPVTVSIRGARAAQVLVLLDGAPLNDPITGEADLSTVDPATIERVDVLRGAQSARYGGQALAGVIAVTTRGSGAMPPTLSLGAGQWGERRASGSASGEHGGRVNRLAVHSTVSWQRLAGDFVADLPAARGGGSTRRANADMQRVALSNTGRSSSHR
jgi:outer membrane receptor protein involved in Fe transport